MDEDLRAQWERFLNGHWQLEVPQKPGKYPTKHLTKDWQYPDIVVYEHLDGTYHSTTPDFGGYIWSEPRPNMPGCR